jgi:hypothetical protein
MIYVQMGGRLGNQLFRYAAARAVQEKYYPNEPLCFDYSYLAKEGTPETGWVDSLQDFNTINYLYHTKDGVIMHEGSLHQKIVCMQYYSRLRKFTRYQMNEEYLYEKRWSSKLNRNGIYWYRTGYIPLTKSDCRDKLMSGCFESSSYFNDIRGALLKEFTPRKGRLPQNFDLYDVAESEDSVCISVRRGDFESNPSIQKLHSVCSREYFLTAIKLMLGKLDNPKLVFFSDDIDWVKENIRVPDCKTYYETGQDPVWEKLRLMSTCHHFIISNSSFSWWAQWLSRRDDKIVISPSRWFNNGYESGLIESSMIKIPV